jgi:hypothetical protein
MGRFEPEDQDRSARSGPIGSATDELRSQIERQIAEIVDAAQDKATAIEDAALEKAKRIELESERRAHEIIENAVHRTVALMGSIEALENGVDEMVGSLRAETEELIAELQREAAGKKQTLGVEQELMDSPGESPGTAPQSPSAPGPEAPSQGLTQAPSGAAQSPQAPSAWTADTASEGNPQAVAAPDPIPPTPESVAPPSSAADSIAQEETGRPAGAEGSAQSTVQTPQPNARTATVEPAGVASPPAASSAEIGSPEVREMIREQVTKMRRTGKSREDAARFLMRFKKGRSYLPIIDEVYGQDDVQGEETDDDDEPRGVRGMLWRRRQRTLEEEEEQ